MWTFLSNLWAIGKHAPAIIAAIRAIMDIIGSETVMAAIEAVKAAVVKQNTIDGPPQTEAERVRLLDRIRQRFALDALGMTEKQYIDFCNVQGVAHGIEEQLA